MVHSTHDDVAFIFHMCCSNETKWSHSQKHSKVKKPFLKQSTSKKPSWIVKNISHALPKVSYLCISFPHHFYLTHHHPSKKNHPPWPWPYSTDSIDSETEIHSPISIQRLSRRPGAHVAKAHRGEDRQNLRIRRILRMLWNWPANEWNGICIYIYIA